MTESSLKSAWATLTTVIEALTPRGQERPKYHRINSNNDLGASKHRGFRFKMSDGDITRSEGRDLDEMVSNFILEVYFLESQHTETSMEDALSDEVCHIFTSINHYAGWTGGVGYVAANAYNIERDEATGDATAVFSLEAQHQETE